MDQLPVSTEGTFCSSECESSEITGLIIQQVNAGWEEYIDDTQTFWMFNDRWGQLNPSEKRDASKRFAEPWARHSMTASSSATSPRTYASTTIKAPGGMQMHRMKNLRIT
jgi:hypothetical protein